jgi:hypothetical protein
MTSTAEAQYAAACFGNYVVNETITSQVSNGNLPSVSESALFKAKKKLFFSSVIISFLFIE